MERIADFLRPGEGIWWETDKVTGSVTFYDGDNSPNTRPEGPPLHHFRSWTIEEEVTYIKQCWDKCVNSDLRLPIKQIKLFDKEENTKSFKAYEGINSGKIPTLDEIRQSHLERQGSQDTERLSITADQTSHVSAQGNDICDEDYDNDPDNDDIPIAFAVLQHPDFIPEEQLEADDKEIQYEEQAGQHDNDNDKPQMYDDEKLLEDSTCTW